MPFSITAMPPPMLLLLLLLSLSIFPQDARAISCRPELVRVCPNVTCEQICRPVCDKADCEVICTNPAHVSSCEKPTCYTSCAEDQCATEHCPACETNCKPTEPRCTAAGADCDVQCEAPQCRWICEADYNACPPPACHYVMESPACESPNSPPKRSDHLAISIVLTCLVLIVIAAGVSVTWFFSG